MKAIVVYKSNTGFTKKYAEWIAKELACQAVAVEKAKNIVWKEYDAVVFGGWMFAGSIKGLSECREQLNSFSGKKGVFAVGAAPTNAPQAGTIFETCFSEEERNKMGTFYLQGGLDYKNMNFFHKLMMNMMCRVMKKQKGVESAEYKQISESFDATEKAAIEPLIRYMFS